MIHQITESMQHAARIFLAEAAELAVSAAWIVGKDRLELRRPLARKMELLRRKGANADHADIAVAPGLSRDPLDDIVAIPFARAAIAGFEIAARRTDHVDGGAQKEKLGISGLRVAKAERRPRRLRRKMLRQFVTLQFLGVHAERKEYGKGTGRVRPVHVDDDVHSIAHAHGHIPVTGDRLVQRRPPIIGWRLMSRGK